MAVYERDVTTFTRTQALIWLKKNDPEYDWLGKGLSREELVAVIRDNLGTFGEANQAPGLRAVWG